MNSCDSSDPRHTTVMLWMLRTILLVHAFGIASTYLFSEMEIDSDIRSLVHFDYGYAESTADTIDKLGHSLYLGIAIAVFVLPLGLNLLRIDSKNSVTTSIQVVLISYLCCWAFALAAVKSFRNLGEYPEALTIGSQAVRYLTPAALIAVLCSHKNMAMWFLRIGSASTFCFHGVAALMHKGSFVDLLINSSQNLLAYDMSESTANALLYLIGAIDVVAAFLILIERSRFVSGYMASWGLITAFSRMTAGGFEQYPELLIRAAHYGSPAAIFYQWQTESASCRPPAIDNEINHDTEPLESN